MNKYTQDYLPNFLKSEAEARESAIDKEAFIRHKQAMVQRWFGYYKKCKSNRNTIIDQYNKIALMKGRE